jgi:hypothetical protein
MSGLLCVGGGAVWALDPWPGSRLIRMSCSGRVERVWSVGALTDASNDLPYELMAGTRSIAVTEHCFCLLSDSGDLFGVAAMASNEDLLRVEATRTGLSPTSSARLAAGSESEIALVGDGGDRILRTRVGAEDLRPLFTESSGHGRCGILSSAAYARGELVCASHVFGECFRLVPRQSGWQWSSFRVDGLSEPYLVAEWAASLVVLGKTTHGTWAIGDSGEFHDVSDALGPDEDPVGFVAVGSRYLLLVESTEPAVSLVVLRPAGGACEIESTELRNC